MKKRILIISNDMPLALGLYSGLHQDENTETEITYEPNGSLAYNRIKDTKPDLLFVDIETPGLVSSWMASELEGVTIKDMVPTVGISRILSNEEREILSDMTGVQIYHRDVSSAHLNQNILPV